MYLKNPLTWLESDREVLPVIFGGFNCEQTGLTILLTNFLIFKYRLVQLSLQMSVWYYHYHCWQHIIMWHCTGYTSWLDHGCNLWYRCLKVCNWHTYAMSHCVYLERQQSLALQPGARWARLTYSESVFIVWHHLLKFLSGFSEHLCRRN